MRNFLPLIICTVCFGTGVLAGGLTIEKDDRVVVKIPGEKTTVTIRKMSKGWHPTFEKDEVTIRFKWTEDKPLTCGKETASGCAWIDRDPCEILLNPIEGNPTVGQLMLLGHETLHCIRGAWHDK